MIEIFVNDEKLELKDSDIFQTFQNNNVGSVNDRQTSFTNNIKIPRTPRNTRIFNKIGLIGIDNSFSATEFPFGFPSVKMLEDGIEILPNGYIKLSSIDEYFNVSIYGAEKTFFETIKNYTLRDVDYIQGLNIIYDEFNFRKYCQNTQQNGLLIAWAFFNDSMEVKDQQSQSEPWNININMLTITPQLKVSAFFDSIFETFGYSVDHNFGALDDFNDLVINHSTGVSSMNLTYGDTVAYSDVAPEINLKSFVIEILYRFAATIKIDEQTKTVYIRQWVDIISSTNFADWSNKFDSLKSQKYNLKDYGQLSYMIYQEDIAKIYNFAEAFENELSGEFEIQNLHLDKEKTILQSIFKKCPYYKEQDLSIAQGGSQAYNFLDLIDWIEYPEEFKTLDGYLLYLKKIDSHPGYSPLEIRVTGPASSFYVTITMGQVQGEEYALILSYVETSFQNYIDNYYQEFIEMLNDYQQVNAYLLLDVMDLFTLDYFKKIYIKQLAGYYYLNKIINYRKGKLTEVELIKIP